MSSRQARQLRQTVCFGLALDMEFWLGSLHGILKPPIFNLFRSQVDASNMEGGMLPFQNADMPNNGFPVGHSPGAVCSGAPATA